MVNKNQKQGSGKERKPVGGAGENHVLLSVDSETDLRLAWNSVA